MVDCTAGHEYSDLKTMIREEQAKLNLEEVANNCSAQLKPEHDVIKDIFLSHVGGGPVTLNDNNNNGDLRATSR